MEGGATIISGDGADRNAAVQKPAVGYYVSPTILSEVSDENEAWDTEIFGPVRAVWVSVAPRRGPSLAAFGQISAKISCVFVCLLMANVLCVFFLLDTTIDVTQHASAVGTAKRF